MRANAGSGRSLHGGRWRLAGWGGAALLLTLLLVAMSFTDEVNWTAADFAVFGALLAGVGGGFELTLRRSRNRLALAGFAVALATAFLLLWVNGAVGIVGDEDNPANPMFAGVVAVAVAGAALARMRPRGMARALFATALAQALAALVARAAGWGDAWAATAFLVAAWLLSAWLFRRAAHAPAAAGTPG